ncbi:MAG TPA: sigma-70 family RNA polymerase sigma factor [Ramlibacter sp.]|nr:sigma-70 family RNA polymerase sigma factor [Ramlibacter sp.]
MQPSPKRPFSSPSEQDARLGQLIACARLGEVGAFEELHARTATWLLSRVRRIVRDGQAEDVLADVFIKVWHQLDSYDSRRAQPSAWLAVIARSSALDHLRKEKDRGNDREVPELLESWSDADGPEHRLARAEEASMLHMSLRDLTAAERTVIGLAYFRDLTQQEIAAATGLSLQRTKSLMSGARDKMRERLLLLRGRTAPFDPDHIIEETKARKHRSGLGARSEPFLALRGDIATDPASALQRLVEAALKLTGAGSAGISLEDQENGDAIFRWVAIAGEYERYLHGTMPRYFSPCGTVLERGKTLVMRRPVCHYPYISRLHAPCSTVMLTPFARSGKLVGTVWVVDHTDKKVFSRNDQQAVESLAGSVGSMLDGLRSPGFVQMRRSV